ncbi:MAG: glycosyl transferase family 1 [Betaproteobacteria bacterium RBG_16_64_18]|nr:MAG: glycosyl transferase family 1 [Betaproteobacteria bacterium RBG_16_64_18]
MKLALIRQRYNPYGGAERFVARAIEALKGQGVAVTVFARDWETREDEPAVSELVRCDPFYLGRLWRDASFARAACRALAQRRFDLVQSHERIACCDIYRAGDGVHAQWLDNRRRALGAWGRLGVRVNPYHAYVLAAERRLYASARLRAVICNSRMVAGEIRRRFAVPEGRLHVIYSGVDLEAFHPRLRGQHRRVMRARLGIAESDMLYLLVGSGFERKGVPQLLEALARLRGARLAIVGADRRTDALRRRADALGMGSRVVFAGPQREVLSWYGAADCFVLPTLYDPFPNAALEAMASGLPVITSPSCGAAELIVEGENGFVCDALDVAALADRMEKIDPVSARLMGEHARSSVAGLGLADMAERLVALYRSLAA